MNAEQQQHAAHIVDSCKKAFDNEQDIKMAIGVYLEETHALAKQPESDENCAAILHHGLAILGLLHLLAMLKAEEKKLAREASQQTASGGGEA